MAFDSTAFINDLLKDVQLSDDQKTVIQSTLTNPSVVKRLEEGQMRQADYSRLANEARTAYSKANEWYNTLSSWQEQEAERIAAERAAFTTTQPTQPTQPVNNQQVQQPKYLTPDELNRSLANQGQDMLTLLGITTAKAFEYMQNYGKTLDVGAVTDLAKKENLTWERAFDIYAQPEKEAKTAKELDERIKRERAEAAAEALANVSMPTAPGTSLFAASGPTHVLDRRADTTAQFGWKAAAAAHVKDIASGSIKYD